MVTTYRYLPMLRSKTGEATALTHLTPAAKDRLIPVIQMVHKPPGSFADTVAPAWTGRPMALDGTFNTFVSGSPAEFAQLHTRLGKGGVLVTPSVEYGAAPNYLAAVQKVRGNHAPGVLVKAKLNQLHDVGKWVAAQGWQPNEVDFVVTLGEIGGYDPNLLAPVIIKSIVDNLPHPSSWRSVTLSASSAPKDMGEMSAGRNDVPRQEWRIWKDVVASLPDMHYSDFSSAHPELTDPPGYVMTKATVSVRYAVDDYWIVLKGRPTSGKSGQSMTTQYRAHAKTLKADPSFGGLPGCWGDDRIENIAGGAISAGGRSQWASYVASRHLSLVADRLP